MYAISFYVRRGNTGIYPRPTAES